MEQLSKEECPLCAQKHPPRFHCLAPRSYRIEPSENGGEETATTKVVRIFCENNYRIRKRTGEEKQYTLTILPGFLIPYSTIPVDLVHQALDNYITNPGLMEVGAALKMRCLNAASFRLFYSRVCRRVEQWTTLLLRLVLSLGGKIKEADASRKPSRKLQAQWAWFLLLAYEYLRVYSR
ncbi:MAG: hypothetical protein DRP87_20070, partial [Spirochaetes bacterium]